MSLEATQPRAKQKWGPNLSRRHLYTREVRNSAPTPDEAYREMSKGTQTEFKSPKEIARLCGLSSRAIYRAIGRGELPASRLCGRLRCRTVDVEKWIERNLVEPVPTLKQLPPDGRAAPEGRGSLRQMLRATTGAENEH
jgi:excisionase family DNA binding protein